MAALAHNYSANDFSRYWYADDHGRNILNTLERNAVIFPSGDHNTFPLIYLHRVRKMRPDVTIADKYGYVESRDFPQIRERTRDGIRVPRDRVIHYLLSETDRPLYFTVKTAVPGDLKVQQIQAGLLYRVGRTPPRLDPKRIWLRYRYRNIGDGFKDTPDYGAVNTVSDYFYFQGLSMLKEGRPQPALEALARAGELATGIKEVYNNIGSALAENGLLDVAREYYRRALSLDDTYVNGLWNVARTSMAVGDFKEAAGYFEKLREVTPEDYRVPGELGFLSLRRLGQTRQAVEYLAASLALNDKQQQIHNALKKLGRDSAGELIPFPVKADRDSHDFGNVPIGQQRRTAFSVTNASKAPLTLTDVRADCGCVTPKALKKELGPGETTVIDVTFLETKRFGPSTKKITIKTSTGDKLQLVIQATVIPLFQSNPTELRIAEAVPKIAMQTRVDVTSHDGKPFRIQSVQSSMSEVRPVRSKATSRPSARHTVALQVEPGGQIGRRQGKLTVSIDDEKHSVVSVPVILEVRSPLVLRPRSVFLNSVARGAVKTATVRVDLPEGWSVRVTDTASSAPWLQLKRRPERLRKDDVLDIEITTQKLPNTFSGTVTLQTDHPSVPHIVVPVYGFVER